MYFRYLGFTYSPIDTQVVNKLYPIPTRDVFRLVYLPRMRQNFRKQRFGDLEYWSLKLKLYLFIPCYYYEKL